MADYFAVLQRTLSGFSDPKPELRVKLYERARVTIERQLQGRTPAVSEEAMAGELAKLEMAITQIEQSYDPSYSAGALEAEVVETATEVAAEPVQQAPQAEPVPHVEQAPQVEQAPKAVPQEFVQQQAIEEEHASQTREEPQQDVDVEPNISASYTHGQQQVYSAPSQPVDAPSVFEESPVDEGPVDEVPIDSNLTELNENTHDEVFDHGQADSVNHFIEQPPEAENEQSSGYSPAQNEATQNETVVSGRLLDGTSNSAANPAVPPASPSTATKPSVETEPVVLQGNLAKTHNAQAANNTAPNASAPVAAVPAADSAMADFEKEFLGDEISNTPEIAASEITAPEVAVAAVTMPEVDTQPELPRATQLPPLDEMGLNEPQEEPVVSSIQASDIPAFDPAEAFNQPHDDGLTIPPAVGVEDYNAKRGRKRALGKWVLVLFLLVVLGSTGLYAWQNKDSLLAMIGLSDELDETVKPKPVRTITITPETETSDETQDLEPEESTTPAEEENKSEERLTTDDAAANEEQAPIITEPTPEVNNIQPAPATAVPKVAQSALLYEEGASASENTIDTGHVVWRVVEGETSEPTIQARVEITSRNLILLMTIKRNDDKALPASHMLELVFVVPDDFSGRGIGKINRVVFKENEQGRGEALVGVPARIADGIFLIALNNLEAAQQKNETLLQTRNWIDIPMQYTSGRRALITLEKGAIGTKVFKEVFEAWGKL